MAPDSAADVAMWADLLEKTALAPDVPASKVAGVATRQLGRRLTDKILVAVHHACDLGDFDVAQDLLRVLEKIMARKPTLQHVARRRSMDSLVAAHERLWQLRNPDTDA